MRVIIVIVISFDTQHSIYFLQHTFMALQGVFQELCFSSTSSSPASFVPVPLRWRGRGGEERKGGRALPKRHLPLATCTDAGETGAWALLVLSPGERSWGPVRYSSSNHHLAAFPCRPPNHGRERKLNPLNTHTDASVLLPCSGGEEGASINFFFLLCLYQLQSFNH